MVPNPAHIMVSGKQQFRKISKRCIFNAFEINVRVGCHLFFLQRARQKTPHAMVLPIAGFLPIPELTPPSHA
jgi:hypothetical protein